MGHSSWDLKAGSEFWKGTNTRNECQGGELSSLIMEKGGLNFRNYFGIRIKGIRTWYESHVFEFYYPILLVSAQNLF